MPNLFKFKDSPLHPAITRWMEIHGLTWEPTWLCSNGFSTGLDLPAASVWLKANCRGNHAVFLWGVIFDLDDDALEWVLAGGQFIRNN